MFNCIMIEEAKFGLGSTLQNNLVSSINASQGGEKELTGSKILNYSM